MCATVELASDPQWGLIWRILGVRQCYLAYLSAGVPTGLAGAPARLGSLLAGVPASWRTCIGIGPPPGRGAAGVPSGSIAVLFVGGLD